MAETKWGAEAIAVEHLRRQNFETMLPEMMLTRRDRHGVDQQITRPLFPNYVFVAFDVALRAWRSINGTRGVKCVLGSGPESPSPLPQSSVDGLIARLSEGPLAEEDELPRLLVGEHARVDVGPFASHVGQVVENTRKRVQLLLFVLGAERRLSFLPEHVVPV